MATATATKKGFKVSCPKCGQRDCLRLDVDDLAVINCTQCEDEVSPADIRTIIAEWSKLLAFIDSAPDVDE